MVMSSKKIGKMVGADVDKALANIGSTRPEIKVDETIKAAVAPQKAPSFAEAFRAARKDPEAMKRGTFTFGGKSYTTKLAGEGAKKPATARPSTPARSSAATPARSSAATLARSSAATPTSGRPAAFKMDARFLSAKTSPVPAATPAKKDAFTARLESKGAPKPQPTRAERMAAESAKNVAAYKAKQKAKADAERAAKAKREGELKRGFRAATQGSAPFRAMAKGGKVDGCAIRGKTRAMKKGK